MEEQVCEREKKIYNLALFLKYIQNGCGLSLWLLDKNGVAYEKAYLQKNIQETILFMLLEAGGCLEKVLEDELKEERPLIVSDSMGMVWIAEWSRIANGEDKNIVLMGPLFNSEISLKIMEKKLRALSISLTIRSQCMDVLKEIPVLETAVMNHYIRMFHWGITNEQIEPSDFVYISDNSMEDEIEESESLAENHYTDYERSMAREKVILNCIREGNLNYRQLLNKEGRYVKRDNYGTGDPVREAKDTVIIFTALCSRVAMEEKLSIKTAKEIELHTIRKVEQATSVTEISNIKKEMMEEYIYRVYELQKREGISKQIRECCDYLQAHILEDISLEDAARNVGYTEYYLSRKFQKEMGIKIGDYIRKARIRQAKIWLSTTDMSVQQISDYLHFGTRSYFTRCFKKSEGITPQEYREKAQNS